MKKQLLLLVFLFSISIIQSQTFNDGVLEYTVIDVGNNYVSVKKYNNVCPTGELTIPLTVINSSTTYTITSIEYGAFYNYTSLTSIDIPLGVINIGIGAFNSCTGLTSVNIPLSVEYIGWYAFHDCSSLTSVTVNWVTPIVINENVFENVNISNIPLTVPPGTVADYKNTAVWQDFGSIVLDVADFTANDITVQIYPNPVHDQLRIDVSSGLSIEQITIYNNLGQLIQ